MQIEGPWLNHPGTQRLCAALMDGGHQVLFVGGCVRNALLGLPVSDIDLTTDATPARVTALCEAAGLRVVPTGVDHGTVTVIANHLGHEVTTFRRDVATDGRRAVVAFSTRIEDDAARRDFTMNALYATPDGQVVDPLGGAGDLARRRVRFVGDASLRIREDYLRVLRYFRFHAHFGDPAEGLDAEALSACAELADGMEVLSRERVGHEMRKLLSAADPAPSVAAMAAAGILSRVLPGADFRALAPLVHLEGGLAPDWRRRLAVLGGADPAGALKLSRAEARDMAALRGAIQGTDSPAVLGFRLKALGAGAVLARAAVLEAALPANWQKEIARGMGARVPLSAGDLPGLQGPMLGAALAAGLERWLKSDLRLTRDQLMKP